MTRFQMKTGTPITLLQLLISITLLLAGAVGLYVKSEVRAGNLEDRMLVLEKQRAQSEANMVARTQARNQELRELDVRIDKNTQDIEILKATKKDK